MGSARMAGSREALLVLVMGRACMAGYERLRWAVPREK